MNIFVVANDSGLERYVQMDKLEPALKAASLEFSKHECQVHDICNARSAG